MSDTRWMDAPSYGILQGDRVQELEGDLFGSPRATERRHALART